MVDFSFWDQPPLIHNLKWEKKVFTGLQHATLMTDRKSTPTRRSSDLIRLYARLFLSVCLSFTFKTGAARDTQTSKFKAVIAEMRIFTFLVARIFSIRDSVCLSVVKYLR